MSERALLAGAVWGVLRRDAFLFASYRLRVVTQAVAIFFTTVLFYYVSRLVRVDAFPTPDDYFAYVVVGLVILELLTSALSTTPVALRNELVAGTFERMAVAPIGPRAAVVAMAGFPALLSLLVGSMTVLVAVVFFGLDLQASTAPLAPLAALLAVYAFLPFTVFVASLVLLVKQAGSASAFLVTGLALTSGAFFPVSLLPSWISWVSEIQPLTPALELLRHLLIGTPTTDPPAVEALRLLAFGTVLLPVALAVLGHVVHVCRRRGTLTEY